MGGAMMEALKSKGFDVVGVERGEALLESDCYVLAMKPQDFVELDVSGKLVISIITGISIQKIKDTLKVSKVVRAMPNLPLKVGKALTGWVASEEVNGEEKRFAKEIFKSFGEEIELDSEEKINAITALSGSGPAYFYFLAEAVEKAALACGFSKLEATKIAITTLVGSGALLDKNEFCLSDLRKKITSKGGTTEAAIKYMEDNGMEKIVKGAICAAKKRAEELNK